MADMADEPMDEMVDEELPPVADDEMTDMEMPPPEVETAEPTDDDMAEADAMDESGEGEPEPAMTEAQARNAVRRGELDVEGLIAGIRDGSIGLDTPPPTVSYDSPTWWADVDDRRSVPPFLSLVPNVVSFDDYERVRQAVAERRNLAYEPLPDTAAVTIAPMPEMAVEMEGMAPSETPVPPMEAPMAEPTGEAPRFEAPATTLPEPPVTPVQGQ